MSTDTHQQNSSKLPIGGKITNGFDDNKPDEEYLDRGRMYCGYDDEILEIRSVNRYRFSLNYVNDGDICLDAACGTGYGSQLIGQKAGKVIGLEISDHALKYAQENYQNDKVEFRKADLTQPFDLPDDYFDVIVSVETLEHISDHDAMLSEFKRILKPDGLIIITTVDHHIYSVKGGIKNKFHIGELTKKELLKLMSRYFKLEELYGHLKFVPLPWRKRFTKKMWVFSIELLTRLDVLGIRYRILEIFHLNKQIKTFSHNLSTMVETGMEKSDFQDENDYYQLLVVARKL